MFGLTLTSLRVLFFLVYVWANAMCEKEGKRLSLRDLERLRCIFTSRLTLEGGGNGVKRAFVACLRFYYLWDA